MDSGELVVPTFWLSNSKLVADSVALGPGVMPIPLKERRWGLPAVSSVTVMEALRGPIWLGAKVTLIVQLAPGARLEAHVPFSPKSLPAAMLFMTTGELPVLVSL